MTKFAVPLDPEFVSLVPDAPPELLPYFRLWASAFKLHIIDASNEIKKRFALEAELGRELAPYKLEMWMASDAECPASFAWMCRLFNMSPDIVRAMIYRRHKELAVLGRTAI